MVRLISIVYRSIFSDLIGSGKTHAFRQIEKAMMKTEKVFSSTYLKPVRGYSGIISSSLVERLNQ